MEIIRRGGGGDYGRRVIPPAPVIDVNRTLVLFAFNPPPLFFHGCIPNLASVPLKPSAPLSFLLGDISDRGWGPEGIPVGRHRTR